MDSLPGPSQGNQIYQITCRYFAYLKEKRSAQALRVATVRVVGPKQDGVKETLQLLRLSVFVICGGKQHFCSMVASNAGNFTGTAV